MTSIFMNFQDAQDEQDDKEIRNKPTDSKEKNGNSSDRDPPHLSSLRPAGKTNVVRNTPHFWSVMRALFASECESGELAACLVQYAETGFPRAFRALSEKSDPDWVRRTLASIYRRMAKEGHTGLQESVAADPQSFAWLEPYIAQDAARIESIQALDAVWSGPRDDTDRRVIEHCAEQDLVEAFGERAAVMEYDGGLTREQAERAAAAGLVPEGWSASAWHERLTHMAEICINPERAAEIKNMASALTTVKQ